MKEISSEDVKKKYNNMNEIWPVQDKWHRKTYTIIYKYIHQNFSQFLNPDSKLLNAGSGGNTYELFANQIHVDISNRRISDTENHVVCDICSIPFEESSFDACLCVGSVINYCDAMCAIKEISRVLKNTSCFLLEFETSSNIEYYGTKEYKKSVGVTSTFYQDKEEIIYIYSEKYITNILKENGFKLLKKCPFHILSPYVYKISNNSNFASAFSLLDCITKKIPFVNRSSCNIILLCQKIV